MRKRQYPGGMSPAQWGALPRAQRFGLVRRAQCDLLGSFRFCNNKNCRRTRSCAGADPNACAERLWRLAKKKPKTLREAYARIAALTDA